jgi:hypothetical protein
MHEAVEHESGPEHVQESKEELPEGLQSLNGG